MSGQATLLWFWLFFLMVLASAYKNKPLTRPGNSLHNKSKSSYQHPSANDTRR